MSGGVFIGLGGRGSYWRLVAEVRDAAKHLQCTGEPSSPPRS